MRVTVFATCFHNQFNRINRQRFIEHAESTRAKGEARVNRNTVYGYATSGGVGAYEVKGEINGVFMKSLKRRISNQQPVHDMLRQVFRGRSPGFSIHFYY